MKKLLFLSLMLMMFGNVWAKSLSQSTLTPVGEWTFDNPSDLCAAAIGNPLVANGTSIAAIEGTSSTDGAVRVGKGSNFTLTHGITPFPNAFVNTYTLVFDFRVNQLNRYYSFYQTNVANNNDAEVFLGKLGNVGVGATGYTSQTVRPNAWNRAVIVVNNGVEFSVYLNGVKGLTGYVQPLDGNFSLDPSLLLFADNDGEDNEIDCAHVWLYNKALSETEAQSLGGYTHAERTLCSFLSKPYIQNVTPDSITVMWESDFIKAGSNKVNFGTNADASGAQVIAKAIPSGANTYIQKAVLKPLQAGTTYYFRAISNSTPNMIQSVKAATKDPNSVFTVGIWGDSQNLNPFINMASYLVNNLSPDFCFSTGNVTINGNDSIELRKVFIPAVLETVGTKVPFFESFGNKDVNAIQNDTDIIRNYIEQPKIFNSDASKVNGSFAYEYGNSVFISIDWSRYNTDLVPNGWLENFLKSDVSKQAKFRFIFIHNAPFYERMQSAEQDVVKTNIPLLSKIYGVTAVFSGHMHGYERGVLDGVQYITQGGCSDLDVDVQVGPKTYSHIVSGTNKQNNPTGFNNGLSNHLLTLEITPETATSKLHYFDATGKYIGVIESVEMTPRAPLGLKDKNLTTFDFSISPNPTKGILKINAPENFNLTVFNLQGIKVFNKLNVSPNSDIDLSDLGTGAYLVKLNAGQNEFTKTILIK
jgi:hypothetical protein